MGIIRDISVRKESHLALEAALASRDILLKEIHHRVKNNLQVVSSLLNIQEPGIIDEASRKVFIECQTQIQTMAMVHEVLYRSSSYEGVDMKAYFEQLVDYLSSVYEGESRGFSCAVEVGNVILDLDDAMPIALIVNELVSNCMKHAFPDGRTGRILVSIREAELSPGAGDAWLLEVEDDGIGIAEAGKREDFPDKGIGTELVQALAGQLRGTLSRRPGASSRGTLVSMRFPRQR